jgi:hypothetical protein
LSFAEDWERLPLFDLLREGVFDSDWWSGL